MNHAYESSVNNPTEKACEVDKQPSLESLPGTTDKNVLIHGYKKRLQNEIQMAYSIEKSVNLRKRSVSRLRSRSSSSSRSSSKKSDKSPIRNGDSDNHEKGHLYSSPHSISPSASKRDKYQSKQSKTRSRQYRVCRQYSFIQP